MSRSARRYNPYSVEKPFAGNWGGDYPPFQPYRPYPLNPPYAPNPYWYYNPANRFNSPAR